MNVGGSLLLNCVLVLRERSRVLLALVLDEVRQEAKQTQSQKLQKIIYELYENGEGSLLLGVAAARSKSRFILS